MRGIEAYFPLLILLLQKKKKPTTPQNSIFAQNLGMIFQRIKVSMWLLTREKLGDKWTRTEIKRNGSVKETKRHLKTNRLKKKEKKKTLRLITTNTVL